MLHEGLAPLKTIHMGSGLYGGMGWVGVLVGLFKYISMVLNALFQSILSPQSLYIFRGIAIYPISPKTKTPPPRSLSGQNHNNCHKV